MAPLGTVSIWMRRPTGEDIARYYPKAAADAHLEGSATIHCTVLPRGSLTDCATTSEDPVGQGFGDAAVRLSKLFKIRPNVPVSGGEIEFPILFTLP
jgi:protein TonB